MTTVIGLVTGVVGGQMRGWLAADLVGEAVEVVLDDQTPAGWAVAQSGPDGRAYFAVDLSPQLLGQRMRFIDVRLHRDGTPIPGSPVLWDAGLFAAGSDVAEPQPSPELDLGRDLPPPTPPFSDEIACPGYLDGAARELLARLPVEARELGSPAAQLTGRINRLRAERLACNHLSGSFSAALVLLPGEGGMAAQVWSLQSHPGARSGPSGLDSDGLAALGRDASFVFFAAQGDLIHPSAAVCAQAHDADVLVWDRFVADTARAESPGWAIRRPFDPVTVRQGATTDTTFAVRGSLLAEAPAAVLSAVAQGRLHPLWFWLAGVTGRWARHPEALTASLTPRPAEPLDQDLCAELLLAAGAPATLVEASARAATPFLLLPDRRAATISVVMTPGVSLPDAERSLRALLGQRVSGQVELLLLASRAEEEEFAASARRHLGDQHARNVASVGEASGEALIFLQPGVSFDDPLTVEQLSMWALHPGVGAVGCNLRRPNGGVIHGLRTETRGGLYAPPLVEDEDPTFAGHVRAVAGANVALAAISRATFEGVGGFDPRFAGELAGPALMLACVAQGFFHLHLGHLSAQLGHPAVAPRHATGSQARLLQSLYPAQLSALASAGVRDRVDLATATENSDLAVLHDLATRQTQAQARAEAARAEVMKLLNLADASRRLPLGD